MGEIKDGQLERDLGNNYENFKFAGSGSYAKVYKAQLKTTKEIVAIKFSVKDELIYNESIVSARDEISILKKMNNPNIIRIFDHIETIERIYVIVEVRMQHILKFCPISLSQVIENCFTQGLREDIAFYLFWQIANAISALKYENIIHRDIKLDNIMLQPHKDDVPFIQRQDKLNTILRRCKVKLIDFGISKQLKDDELTQSYAGSKFTLSPEIYEGLPYGWPVDMYSLGTILFALVTGDYPYKKNWGAVHPARVHPPNFGKTQLQECTKIIILRMLEVDPNKRLTYEQLYSERQRLPSQQNGNQQNKQISFARPVSQIQPYVSLINRRSVEDSLVSQEIQNNDNQQCIQMSDQPQDQLLKKKKNVSNFFRQLESQICTQSRIVILLIGVPGILFIIQNS